MKYPYTVERGGDFSERYLPGTLSWAIFHIVQNLEAGCQWFIRLQQHSNSARDFSGSLSECHHDTFFFSVRLQVLKIQCFLADIRTRWQAMGGGERSDLLGRDQCSRGEQEGGYRYAFLQGRKP